MEGIPLFEHPVQTIKAVSVLTEISRTTILKACKGGPLKDCAYKSLDIWLIDTTALQTDRNVAFFLRDSSTGQDVTLPFPLEVTILVEGDKYGNSTNRWV
jgi:hypothetical protein